MKRTFFSRHALKILCLVFFLVPFALRGARLSLERMENNVKDWLPSNFQETTELAWFARHFMGEESFILLTYEGCSEDDESFQLFVDKLRAEVAGPDEPDGGAGSETEPPGAPERIAHEKRREMERARLLGDELGLHTTGNFYPNWGQLNEKWLKGDDGWYFITPEGRLYQWEGRPNLAGAGVRAFKRRVLGQTQVEGVYIDTFGTNSTFTDKNDFHADPSKLTARVLKSVTTGPDLINVLSSPDGPLWPYGTDYDEDDRRSVARVRAYERLKGAMFASAAFDKFQWTSDDLPRVLGEEKSGELPADWQARVDQYISNLVDVRYGGDHQRLLSASLEKRDRFWREMFERLAVEPPATQTAIMVTLSKAGTKDLRRVIGRGILGKPRGRIIDLALESGIPGPPQPPLTPWGREDAVGGRVLRMGGPPVDNVAIDEEGQITLVRLVGFSIGLGLVLSFMCFRSVLVTLMVFLVGGISAVTSLSIVYWTNSSVDAVLMSMPALVYVLGLSGAIHIVNYYRDAAQEHGVEGAPGRALRLGWLPCTLAAFTTALGLMSLYKSNIFPIKKFGLFSALGVMATLALLFTYLPAALQVWPPGYHRRRAGAAGGRSGGGRVAAFWETLGGWVVRRHWWVTATCVIALAITGYGITKLNTSIQLLKLFDPHAKIIRDYAWLEDHVGKLVPMELVIRIDESKQQATNDELSEQSLSDAEQRELKYKYKFLQRIGIVAQIQRGVEETFGIAGQDIVGRALSAASFAPDVLAIESNYERATVNQILERNVDRYREEDYLRLDEEDLSELWRISVRLGALNDVDYGEFVSELKRVVEPVVAAYDHHEEILRSIEQLKAGQNENGPLVFNGTGILVLGASSPEAGAAPQVTTAGDETSVIDQNRLFTRTLDDLLRERGYRQKIGRQRPKMWLAWNDPDVQKITEIAPEAWSRYLQQFDCVVLVKQHPDYELNFIQEHSKAFIDATDHVYVPGAGSLTAKERGNPIEVTYTGVVPVVYKAQATLLVSLIDSIGWAFVMIAIVMMFVLRSGPWAMINFRGGLISMLPNLFPVVLIFGIMGHADVLIDIGTMMTASVAMGVAVDDTIHFLSWFREGLRRGLDRRGAILLSYRHVATAMTQTTLIGGLGLSIFAFSTFTPTQRFGIMMLTLLAAALIGDLMLLPAILAGPLGKYFCPKKLGNPPTAATAEATDDVVEPGESAESSGTGPTAAPHTAARGARARSNLRIDSKHK